MRKPDLFERIAKLLGLPIKVVRAYARISPSEVKAAYRKVTSASAAARANKQRQNELWKKWHEAGAEDRPAITQDLFKEVEKHARNLVWRRLPEAAQSNLPKDI